MEDLELKEEQVNNESEAEATSSKKVAKDEKNYSEMSPMKLILRRFFRSKLSLIGLIMIVGLFVFSFVGPLIYTEWGEVEVDYTQSIVQYEETINYIDEDGNLVTIVQIVETLDTLNDKAKPGGNHILGTDELGQDIFVRLMYGGRISLLIGFIVVILETIVGIIMGGIAGYFGGWLDQIIMRIVDMFNCIPTLPILLIASALIDSLGVDGKYRIYYLMVIITIFGWAGCARMVRGQILSLREQEYITATEVMGLPTWRRIFKHLIPNVMPQLIVNMTLGLGGVILYESTLSYLGLGVQYPYAAWGTMISSAKDTTILSNFVNMWLPAGVMIVIAVLGFNFVGDGLRDAMDPKAKK